MGSSIGDMAKNKTSQKRILAQERKRQALELRKAGATYPQIARQLGYSGTSGAYKAIQTAMKEIIQEPVKEDRMIQRERLNHMLLVLWPKVQQADERAIRTALAVMDKMDRLNGNDAPTTAEINIHGDQTNILVIDGDKEDFIAQMRKLAGINTDGSNKAITAATDVYGNPLGSPASDYDPREQEIVEGEVIGEEVAVEVVPTTEGTKKFNWKVEADE